MLTVYNQMEIGKLNGEKADPKPVTLAATKVCLYIELF